MITRTKADMADDIADRLVDQCMIDIGQAAEETNVPEELRDDADLISLVEDRVFCCDGCGWWCSVDELNTETDQQLCDDCNF